MQNYICCGDLSQFIAQVFLKPACYSYFSKLSASRVNKVYLSGLFIMSATRENIKDKQGFVARVIDRFRLEPRRLQLFLLSDLLGKIKLLFVVS